MAQSIAGWLKLEGGATDFDRLIVDLCRDAPDPARVIRALRESLAYWARPDQMEPQDPDWNTWLILSGRGAGKTFAGSRWVNMIARDPDARIALVGETAADVRDTMIKGASGILACSADAERPIYNPSTRSLRWPSGASALLFSADAPEQLRGPQFTHAWIDELAKMGYGRVMWDNLMMGLRLGAKPRCLVTTTPRPIALIKEIMADAKTRTVRVSTFENAANLSAEFLETIRDKYEGTAIGDQELHGKIVEMIKGALWTRDMINKTRVDVAPDDLDDIYVSIDPSGSATGDEAGIVAVGRKTIDKRAHYFVLADRSGKMEPSEWAREAIILMHQVGGNGLLVEKNFGGGVNSDLIRNEARNLHRDDAIPSASVQIIGVSAGKNKYERSMPVAGLHMQGRVHIVGTLEKLEAELTAFTNEWKRGKDPSPGRLDAMVHGIAHLSTVRRAAGVIGSFNLRSGW